MQSMQVEEAQDERVRALSGVNPLTRILSYKSIEAARRIGSTTTVVLISCTSQ